MVRAKRHTNNKAAHKQNPARLALTRIAPVTAAFAIAILAYAFVPRGHVFAAGELAAIYSDGALELNIPFDDAIARNHLLKIEVVDPSDKQVGTRSLSTSARDHGAWRVTVPIDKALPLEDLAWDRLRIEAGGYSKIVSLSEILRLPVIRIFAQRSYAAGSSAAIRIITVDSKNGNSLTASRVNIEMQDPSSKSSSSKPLFSGVTDQMGTVRAEFKLPGDFGSRQLVVSADTSLGNVVAKQPVQLERLDRILLTTDKPIYQPGQTMHLRALALNSQSRAAESNQPMTLEVEDAKGNKVFKKRGSTDKFGKPLGSAQVTLKLTTFDVQSVEIGQVTGKTDSDGHLAFSTKLPNFMAGRSTEQGSAPVSIAVEVKDSAGHTESKSRNILVSNTPIIIMAVPESGSLLPGLENQVYILTSYPDGAPAETQVTVNNGPSALKTDPSGVAILPVAAGNTPVVLDLKAADARGRTAHASITLQSQAQQQSLMLRTNRATF